MCLGRCFVASGGHRETGHHPVKWHEFESHGSACLFQVSFIWVLQFGLLTLLVEAYYDHKEERECPYVQPLLQAPPQLLHLASSTNPPARVLGRRSHKLRNAQLADRYLVCLAGMLNLSCVAPARISSNGVLYSHAIGRLTVGLRGPSTAFPKNRCVYEQRIYRLLAVVLYLHADNCDYDNRIHSCRRHSHLHHQKTPNHAGCRLPEGEDRLQALSIPFAAFYVHAATLTIALNNTLTQASW